MIKTCINKTKIIEFIEYTEEVLFCCEKNKDKLKPLFLSEFSENNEDLEAFLAKLPEIKRMLDKDLAFFMERDPAANSEEEIIACYPGYRAIIFHRLAHILYLMGYKIQARVISEHTHFLTGIDIHPGATIGCPFFIDHGTGIVIGETAIIGDYVKMYQGVTLGAISLSKGSKMKGTKRHPTIGDYVTLYANATILGGEVTIGDYAIIGSNVFLTESVPENYKVFISKPELVFKKK